LYLASEAPGKVDFFVFEHSKKPNGLDVWILSLRALQNGSPKEFVKLNLISFAFVNSPIIRNLVLLN
jgi:hypothetical protein